MGDVLQVDFGQKRETVPVSQEGHTDADEAFVSAELRARGLPWGAGGTVLEHPVTTGAEIEAAVPGCAFNVLRTPLYAQHGDGPHDRTAIDSHVALLRDDTLAKVGIVGKKYGVVQPRSMWRIFDGMDVKWEQVGSLRGGSILYAVASVAKYDVVKGDTVEQLMMLWQALDGSGSVRVIPLGKRLICMNMMSATVRGVQGISIRHTRFAEQRLDFAAKALRRTQEDAVASSRVYQAMAGTRMSGKQFAEVCMKLIPDMPLDPETGEFAASNGKREANRDQLMANFATGVGQDIVGVQGTAWGALNAVTEFTTHQRSSKGGEGARVESNVLGSAQRFAGRAYQAIHAMVG